MCERLCLSACVFVRACVCGSESECVRACMRVCVCLAGRMGCGKYNILFMHHFF